MTDPPTEAAEKAATAEWERQTQYATDPDMRAKALHVALRAFQAALAIQGADELNDYLALCALLGDALDEYGDGLDSEIDPPIH